ncbi:MAG: hypothetical protein QM811_10240 [Pirellulales bacterium]
MLNAAEAFAGKAAAMLGDKDVSSKLLLAQLAMKKGDQEKAVKIQTEVVELSKDAAKPRMQEMLDAYKAGKQYEPKRVAPARIKPATDKDAEKPAADKPDAEQPKAIGGKAI